MCPLNICITFNKSVNINFRLQLCKNKYREKSILPLCPLFTDCFAIRTWQHSNVRFFATLFIGKEDFWRIMVSAACGKTMAAKFRAEIRLASSSIPECSNVYYRPVEHFDSEILTSSVENFTACLDIHKKVVAKQTDGKVTSLFVTPEDIPFTCQVYKKVFAFDKEDIEEKDN